MTVSDSEGCAPDHLGRVALDIFKPACEMAGYNSARANEIRDGFLVFFDPQPNKSVILTRWLSIYGVKLADR